MILFVGDGMGISTVTAARIYHSQQRKKVGYQANLVWDNFPNVGLSKVRQRQFSSHMHMNINIQKTHNGDLEH